MFDLFGLPRVFTLKKKTTSSYLDMLKSPPSQVIFLSSPNQVVRITSIYKPFKPFGRVITGLGDLRSPWLLTTYLPVLGWSSKHQGDLYSQGSKWPYTAGTSPSEEAMKRRKLRFFDCLMYTLKNCETEQKQNTSSTLLENRKKCFDEKHPHLQTRQYESSFIHGFICPSNLQLIIVHNLQQFCEYHFSHFQPFPKVIQNPKVSKVQVILQKIL